MRFWSGDPMPCPSCAGGCGDRGRRRRALVPVPARELGRQRLRFVARLLAAAGYAGWVVLFDEVELIGRYSLLQRGRSYAELARWMRGETRRAGAPDRRGAGDDGRLRGRGASPARTTASWCRRSCGPRRPRRRTTLATPRRGRACASSTGRWSCSRRPTRPSSTRAYARLQGAARRGLRLAPARRRRPGAPRRHPDAPVRAGLDQRVGPGPARSGVPAGTEVVDEAVAPALAYDEDAKLEGTGPGDVAND